MSKKDRISVGFGDLNPVEKQVIGKSLDPSNTLFTNVIKQTYLDQFKDKSENYGHYKGIVLRVDDKTKNEPNSWVRNIFGNDKLPNLLVVKVRIPELHANLPEPSQYGSNAGESHKIIDMYPSFLAVSEEVSHKPVSPGDIVYVDFGNRDNLSDPQYFGPVFNSSVQAGAVGITNSSKTAEKPQNKNELLVDPPVKDGELPKPKEGKTFEQVSTAPTEFSNSPNVANALGNPSQKPSPSADGLPQMRPREVAYKNGKPIGEIDLVEVPPPIGAKPGIFVAKQYYQQFIDLVSAAKKDNIRIILNSGFRSNDQQTYLWNGYKQGKPGFNLAAKPGFSNHQSGIAYDIANTTPNGVVYAWLALNAHKYGFYNAGRYFSAQKEFWHFEFRGVNDTAVIADSKISLEEKRRSFA